MGLKIIGVVAIMIAALSCSDTQKASVEELKPRSSPVQAGEMAPDFSLEDQNNQRVALSSARGNAATVLFFYRGHW